MSHCDEHHWWVAKQVIRHDADRFIMQVDTPTLARFSDNLQAIFFAAANVPDSLSVKDKMEITVCPDPYLDVGQALINSFVKTDITIMEWINIGKWLGYEIPTKYRFSACIWQAHLDHLLTNYPIDMIVCNQPTIINQTNNQISTSAKKPNATADQRISRPGGVNTKEGGAAGGTCSSPGGRSSVAVGQQRDNSSVPVPSSDSSTN